MNVAGDEEHGILAAHSASTTTSPIKSARTPLFSKFIGNKALKGFLVIMCLINGFQLIRMVSYDTTTKLPSSSSSSSFTLGSSKTPGQTKRRCADIPVSLSYWEVAQGSPAVVYIPYAGSINVGDTVCVRVVVPPTIKSPEAAALNSSLDSEFAPLPGTSWESFVFDMVGSNTGINVPIKLQATSDWRNALKDSVHVYQADVQLRDVDVFTPQGFIEFREARWNPEGKTTPQPYDPETIPTPPGMSINVVDSTGDSPYSLAKYLDQPLCTRSDEDGRWVDVSNLPFDSALVPLPDNYNRVWLPYACRLRRIPYEEYAKCLIDRYPRIHLYGDSNTRRALRRFATLGQWCSTKEDIESIECKCNDNGQATERYSISARDITVDMDPVAGGWQPKGNLTDPAATPHGKARINAFKWDGLTSRNNPPWPSFFDKGISTHYGKPNVAIFGFVNWDAAFETHEFFVGEVNRLIDRVASGYPNSTEIIIRTGQYYCCTSDMDKFWVRRYSQLRNRNYSNYVIDLFRQRLGASRKVSLWDVALVSERRPIEARNDVQKCAANHVRSEIVEIENQVLMNAMCN